MLLLDWNQLAISNLMSQLNGDRSRDLSEDLVRHVVLSTILMYKRRFGDEYGTPVLCADDKNYWRKDLFKYYKSGRKKARQESDYDWQMIFTCLNNLRDEIKEIFPYIVIQVPRAEADDIIATLCKYSQESNKSDGTLFGRQERVMIVSADKDFKQLQKYSNVRQFSPIVKKFLDEKDPAQYLKEHIIRGDRGDGIPNILSDDSIFEQEGVKQKALTKKKMETFMSTDPDTWDETAKVNWYRNQAIIDLENVPEEIQKEVIAQYEAGPVGAKRKILPYFVKKQLKHLTESIQDF